ncbi:MAG: ATP-binding protein [Fusobacteriaceae bacterium]|nr:ATP-binding protein [Fusobacteriaceae bacterium]
MKLKADNLYCFDDFELDFSYPKKIVKSTIEYEYLEERPNFRFKRVNIIFGANASGKTSMGRLMRDIAGFIAGFPAPFGLGDKIADKAKTASCEFCFVFRLTLYRFYFTINDKTTLSAGLEATEIKNNDSFENAFSKLTEIAHFDSDDTFETKVNESARIIASLDAIRTCFSYHLYLSNLYEESQYALQASPDRNHLSETMDIVLRTFDQSILRVKKLEEAQESSYIEFKNGDKVLIQDGKVVNPSRLSSGTLEAIKIAHCVERIRSQTSAVFYIDEIFSRTQSDLEIAILSVMIELLGKQSQLFYTTHNTNILEMNLPMHAFLFLRKKNKVEAIDPGRVIKKNDRNLKIAVENDVLRTIPNTDLLDRLFEVTDEEKENL